MVRSFLNDIVKSFQSLGSARLLAACSDSGDGPFAPGKNVSGHSSSYVDTKWFSSATVGMMCSRPGRISAMFFFNRGNWSRSASSCECESQPIGTSRGSHETTKPFRGAVSELIHCECSMLCVKIWAVPRGTATGIGSHSVYRKSGGIGTSATTTLSLRDVLRKLRKRRRTFRVARVGDGRLRVEAVLAGQLALLLGGQHALVVFHDRHVRAGQHTCPRFAPEV